MNDDSNHSSRSDGDARGEHPSSTAAGTERRATRPDAKERRPLEDLDREDELPVELPDAPPSVTTEDAAPESGRLMAVLSHLSVFFGVPVFLIPMFRRSDLLATRHADSAALVYTAFYATLALAMFGTVFAFPVAMLFYLPAIAGVYHAVRGQPPGTWAAGRVAEHLFGDGTKDDG